MTEFQGVLLANRQTRVVGASRVRGCQGDGTGAVDLFKSGESIEVIDLNCIETLCRTGIYLWSDNREYPLTLAFR